MPPATFVVSLGKLYAVGLILRSKIADVHGIEVHDFRTWKFVYFQKIFQFLLHNTRDVTKGARGHSFSGAESLRGGKKLQQCHNHFFQNSTFASERPQVQTWGHQTCIPRRHLTSSLRPCASRLSNQNDEICLQKYLPIGGKLSITSYLKQKLMIIEVVWPHKTTWRSKKVYYFENRHNVFVCKNYVSDDSQLSCLLFPVVENMLTQVHIQLAAKREFMI